MIICVFSVRLDKCFGWVLFFTEIFVLFLEKCRTFGEKNRTFWKKCRTFLKKYGTFLLKQGLFFSIMSSGVTDVTAKKANSQW